MPGGWVGRRKRLPCRWCGSEVPARRRTFCSAACVHEWKLRADPGYLRDQVFLRDKGVCAMCGVDTEALRKNKRKLDYAARRQFEKEWGSRRNLWDADHIVPVVEGGGECDLANMRTLCVKCHRQATAALRERRKSERRVRYTRGMIASELIVDMERAALERWGRGDPDGFLEISSEDVSYFDPFTERRLDGLDALRGLYETIRGKVRIDRFEIVEPRVQVEGDLAVLTFRFESQGSEGATRWNTTEVYRNGPDGWKIIHTHWAFNRPALAVE
jgi:ketosteroid isomerase-like protein/5-methylcytosine-specific restriction endonuclease McrA